MTSMSTPSGRVIFMMTISLLDDGLQKCRRWPAKSGAGGLRKVVQVACALRQRGEPHMILGSTRAPARASVN